MMSYCWVAAGECHASSDVSYTEGPVVLSQEVSVSLFTNQTTHKAVRVTEARVNKSRPRIIKAQLPVTFTCA